MASSRVRPEPPLVVIVGPTASGKTNLAIRLAKEYGGEIISADSRAIYRGLSIGTAKPSLEEQQGVAHWGIDLVSPRERFTVADFQQYALRKIDEIRARGHIPMIVGGTGLYVDAVIYKFQFPDTTSQLDRRSELMAWTMSRLHLYCYEHNIELPENEKNKRHVVNNILRAGRPEKSKHKLNSSTVVVGITTEKIALMDRISQRAEEIFHRPILDEVKSAAQRYGWDNEAMTGNIYPILRRFLGGEITLDAARDQFVIRDRQLAKRQLTWFKRNADIQWFTLDEAYTYIARLLDKVNKS